MRREPYKQLPVYFTLKEHRKLAHLGARLGIPMSAVLRMLMLREFETPSMVVPAASREQPVGGGKP